MNASRGDALVRFGRLTFAVPSLVEMGRDHRTRRRNARVPVGLSAHPAKANAKRVEAPLIAVGASGRRWRRRRPPWEAAAFAIGGSFRLHRVDRTRETTSSPVAQLRRPRCRASSSLRHSSLTRYVEGNYGSLPAGGLPGLRRNRRALPECAPLVPGSPGRPILPVQSTFCWPAPNG